MAVDAYFDSDYQQLQNLLSEYDSPTITFQDGNLYTTGGSSLQIPPLYGTGSVIVNRSPQKNSGTSFDESSLITGSSYDDQDQGGQLQSPTSNMVSVSPMMMNKKPRSRTLQKEPLLPSHPHPISLWQAMQIQRYNDQVIASRMLHQQQITRQHQIVVNDGIAVQRVMSYLNCRRQRPPDNNITYWRLFVNHFYSPLVQRKTCFSSYALNGCHSHGVFKLTEAWNCELCGATSGKGFVETFDVLPRMNQLYFSSDIADELMFLDSPTEKRFADGYIMVISEKAVQETIYVHCRVIHEGKLRVIFTPQLKIISWNFCVKSHEVLLPRRLIASQVNDIVKSATTFKSNPNGKGHDVVRRQDLLLNHQRVIAAGRKLAATVKQADVSEFGLSKHVVRSLQVSEVFNVMNDLITDSINNNSSPIETLKKYGRKTTGKKPKTRNMDFRSPMQQTPVPPVPINMDFRSPMQQTRVSPVPRNMDFRSPMQQTPVSPVPMNYPEHHPQFTGNYISPSPNPISNHGNAIYEPHILYQKQTIPNMYPTSYPSPISPAPGFVGPTSGLKSPSVEQLMLNDLLAHLQSDGTKQGRYQNPNEDYAHIVHGRMLKRSRFENVDNSQVNYEVINSEVIGGKVDNGKGFYSSSSSNQDCNFVKKEGDLDLDEDFTSGRTR